MALYGANMAYCHRFPPCRHDMEMAIMSGTMKQQSYTGTWWNNASQVHERPRSNLRWLFAVSSTRTIIWITWCYDMTWYMIWYDRPMIWYDMIWYLPDVTGSGFSLKAEKWQQKPSIKSPCFQPALSHVKKVHPRNQRSAMHALLSSLTTKLLYPGGKLNFAYNYLVF